MYQPVAGHLAQLVTDAHSPDYISLRPALYVAYVRALYNAFATVAAAWPEHHVSELMKDERFVTDLAWEVPWLPEDEQIGAIRELAAERLGRQMDRYAPEQVDGRPFAEFADDPGPGAANAGLEAYLAGHDVTLGHARAFDAWQATPFPPRWCPSGVSSTCRGSATTSFRPRSARPRAGCATPASSWRPRCASSSSRSTATAFSAGPTSRRYRRVLGILVATRAERRRRRDPPGAGTRRTRDHRRGGGRPARAGGRAAAGAARGSRAGAAAPKRRRGRGGARTRRRRPAPARGSARPRARARSSRPHAMPK